MSPSHFNSLLFLSLILLLSLQHNTISTFAAPQPHSDSDLFLWWGGDDNVDSCPIGKHGSSCTKSCPTTCFQKECLQDSGKCVGHDQRGVAHCLVGYYGSKCQRTCPASCDLSCDSDGKCPGEKGYDSASIRLGAILGAETNAQLDQVELVELFHAMTALMLTSGENSAIWKEKQEHFALLDQRIRNELGEDQWEAMKVKAREEYEKTRPGFDHMKESHAPYFIFSTLAYGKKDVLPEGYHLVDTVFKNKGREISFKAFRNDKDRELIIAYRGSASTQDFVSDFKFFYRRTEYGKIHRGFLNEYEKTEISLHMIIHSQLQKGLDKISFTGHSLGGALSFLGAFYVHLEPDFRHLQYEVVTFGAPAVGNDDFVASYNAAGLGSVTTRYVNGFDPVVSITSLVGYSHVGTQKNLKSEEILEDLSFSNLLSEGRLLELVDVLKAHDLELGYGGQQYDDDDDLAAMSHQWMSDSVELDTDREFLRQLLTHHM